MKTISLATLAAVLMPGLSLAHDLPPVVSDAYVRSTNPRSGAAFMAIHNPRHDDCTLLSASTPAAEQAQPHTTRDEGGVMSMQKVDGLPLPADGELLLQRGGDHVMLMGLTQPLKDGDRIALTLDFGPCGSVTADIPVDNAREAGPEAAAPDHAGH